MSGLSNTRLAYRIMTMPAAAMGLDSVSYEINPEAIRKKQSLVAAGIREGRTPVVVLDNVAEYWCEHPQQDWSASDIPNMSPPWRAFFAEWNSPKRILRDGEWTELPDSQTGAFVTTFSVTEQNRENITAWAQLISVIAGGRPDNPLSEEGLDWLTSRLGRSRWLFSIDYWCTTSRRPLNGTPAWLGATTIALVGEFGELIGDVVTGPLAEELQKRQLPFNEGLFITGLGISFCHCRNVEVRTELIGKEEKWHRRSRCPVLAYHLLDIEPMRRIIDRDGAPSENGLQRALHICRGHFAHYSEDKPLFGKHAGVFWIPDHVRGSEKAGRVIKDYKVKI